MSGEEINGYIFRDSYDISMADDRYSAVSQICKTICEHNHTRDDMLVRLEVDGAVVDTIALYYCDGDDFEIVNDFDEGNKIVKIKMVISLETAIDTIIDAIAGGER